jgi:hypothetical protein
MTNSQHVGDDSTQYETWDRRRVLVFVLAHACRRLDMLRQIEEQRHIALPATAEQEKLLLQMARELKGDDSAAGQHSSAGACNSPTEAVTENKVAPAQDAFNKLDPTGRSMVRDASETLFLISNVLAEGFSEHKQSALGRKDQSQEHAQGNQGEGADS